MRSLSRQNQTWWSGPSTITDRVRSFQKRPSIASESKQCLLASIGPFNTIFLPRKCVSANRVTVIPGGMSTDDRSALGKPQLRSTHSPWSSSHALVPIVAYLPLRPRTERIRHVRAPVKSFSMRGECFLFPFLDARGMFLFPPSNLVTKYLVTPPLQGEFGIWGAHYLLSCDSQPPLCCPPASSVVAAMRLLLVKAGCFTWWGDSGVIRS
jgi:hypothetical protein